MCTLLCQRVGMIALHERYEGESFDRTYAQEARSGVSFVQAEDGIRDIGVTGVQTCALPIYARRQVVERRAERINVGARVGDAAVLLGRGVALGADHRAALEVLEGPGDAEVDQHQ